MPDRSLIRRIQRITEWPDDNPRVLYGVFIPQLNAVYFSLDTAQYAILQPAPGSQENSTTDTTTDDTMSSTLPTREGPEACEIPLIDGGDGSVAAMENNEIAYAPAGGEDGDLNG